MVRGKLNTGVRNIFTSDVGFVIMEIIITAVLLFKILLPTTVYMVTFLLNLLIYYMPRSLSILMSFWWRNVKSKRKKLLKWEKFVFYVEKALHFSFF